MPSHWTYDEFSDEQDLFQGDIIEPTKSLRQILEIVHPHFLDAKYIAFMVTTQSCDLARRRKNFGHQVNLCVVREISSIAQNLFDLACGTQIPGVFDRSKKANLKELLARIVNQNEQAIGLFYLHPDLDAGVSTPCVAMLRIGIALRSKHYDVLKASRRGRLRPEFQAKLGWLVGNLYSRVGTEDWSFPADRKLVQDGIIADASECVPATWLSSDAINRARKMGLSNAEQVSRAINELEPAPLDKRLLIELGNILSLPEFGIPAESQARLLKRLPSIASFAELLRECRKKGSG
ncbi:MAG TPA: hypothetical protein P5081_18100 [Phycisphaerae bacterium]|nr:hypothetical protein [Phycisphaerae bacterium]HRW54785.1 hypothetical protein [Phycisphaerae bacterium]